MISVGRRVLVGAAFLVACVPANNNWPFTFLPGSVLLVQGLMVDGMLERYAELLCAWARPLVLA